MTILIELVRIGKFFSYLLPGGNMHFVEQLKTPGEYPFTFAGKAGLLEGCLVVPEKVIFPLVAILGHPHSLQGGTMNNKVVTTMARAFRELGIPSLRFNFRGVGSSEGVFDNGIGESEDMLILARLWASSFPNNQFIFAGFSFGSYVAYRAAAQYPHQLLLSIAPPVERYDYASFSPAPAVWHILQGDSDEVVEFEGVLTFAAESTPSLPVHQFSDTGHFFHGKLLELRAALMDITREEVL